VQERQPEGQAPSPGSGALSRRRYLVALAAPVAALALLASSWAGAAVVQQGNLRITLLSQVQPYKLPRIGTSPISVFVAGRIAATRGGVPDQLQRLTIKVNRHAKFQSRGLPACHLEQIQPATTARALSKCGPAVVGSGQFWAHIVLPDQGAYPTQGRILIFHGKDKGRSVLFAHIFTAHPFASSFVIRFDMKRINEGAYGSQLSASLPSALGDWGYVDRIKLTLKRKYRYRGRELSYFNAGCPAIDGADRATYHLADALFSFTGNLAIGLRVDKSCGVKE
jgi:hypothetical protein